MQRQGAAKRRKELARLERQKAKDAAKAERKKNKGDKGDVQEGEDPDIAGIVPGPQPPPEE